MKQIALLALLAIVATGCTDDERTISTLRASGFSNITTTGFRAFECGEGDSFSTGFIATSPAGQRVSGTVCCGLLKGCTVRF